MVAQPVQGSGNHRLWERLSFPLPSFVLGEVQETRFLGLTRLGPLNSLVGLPSPSSLTHAQARAICSEAAATMARQHNKRRMAPQISI